MNLEASWKKLILDIDNQSIELASSPEYITLFSEVGLFIWFIYRSDTVTLSDGTAFSFGKLLTDTPFASDAQARNFGKYLTENFSAADAIARRDFGKGLFETANASDAMARGFGKTLNTDIASAADALARTFGKTLTDTTTATDDLDGEATTEDDQEIQFFKVLNHLASASDAKAVTFGKFLAHAASLTDAGSLRSQNYCDFTYFAEDYVGQSRTF